MKKYFSGEKWQYLLHVQTHPADGFYEIRHFEKGSVPIAVLVVILFSFCFSMNRMLAGFVVNDVDPRTVDSLTELESVLMLYALFCVGNWSITCLMNGEGRLKDIATIVGYSLLPMVVTYILATIASQFIAQNEEAIYTLILGIGMAWTVMLVLVGLMQIHKYTLGKTLLVLVLTFIAMLIIIFIALLLFDLINQVYSFCYSIYTELIFRG